MLRFASSLGIFANLLAITLIGASACSTSPDDGGNTSCPAGQKACGGVCKTVQSDPQNCGACGTVCSSGVCNDGICAGGGVGGGGVGGAANTSGAGGVSGASGAVATGDRK